MIRLKLTMTENAQCSRKYFSAKDLDPKYLRANKLRVRICAGRGKSPSAPGRMGRRFFRKMLCLDLRVAEVRVITRKGGRESSEGRNCKSNIADFLCRSSILAKKS
jgi:hypothetical protein